MKASRKPSRFKWIFRILLATILLVALYIAFTFFQVFYYARNDQVSVNTKADAIVVLGAAQYNGKPSPVLKARLDHALDLYNDQVAPKIIVTGGNQDGDNSTEASASANYLIANGVDDQNILRENRGISTYDSLREVGLIGIENEIFKVVLVTDGFHQLRTRSIAKSNGFEVISSPVPNSPISGSQESKHFVSETGRVALGRIIGFRRVSKDSQISQFVQERSEKGSVL